MFKLQARVKFIKTKLNAWNREVFGNIFEDKKHLEQQLEDIHNNWIHGSISQDSINIEKELMQKWNERCEKEEIISKQKSRIQWLKEGERNTKFFHRSAMDYRCNNRITRIQDEQGNVFHSDHEITCQLRNHFKLIETEPVID